MDESPPVKAKTQAAFPTQIADTVRLTPNPRYSDFRQQPNYRPQNDELDEESRRRRDAFEERRAVARYAQENHPNYMFDATHQ